MLASVLGFTVLYMPSWKSFGLLYNTKGRFYSFLCEAVHKLVSAPECSNNLILAYLPRRYLADVSSLLLPQTLCVMPVEGKVSELVTFML